MGVPGRSAHSVLKQGKFHPDLPGFGTLSGAARSK